MLLAPHPQIVGRLSRARVKPRPYHRARKPYHAGPERPEEVARFAGIRPLPGLSVGRTLPLCTTRTVGRGAPAPSGPGLSLAHALGGTA